MYTLQSEVGRPNNILDLESLRPALNRPNQERGPMIAAKSIGDQHPPSVRSPEGTSKSVRADSASSAAALLSLHILGCWNCPANCFNRWEEVRVLPHHGCSRITSLPVVNRQWLWPVNRTVSSAQKEPRCFLKHLGS